MANNQTEAVSPVRGRPKTLPEFGKPELESERSIDMDEIELEEFMHEPVTIFMHKSRDLSDLEVETPNVNGFNQPIIRGQKQTIKRKYVEALARCYTIGYEQQVQDPTRPENIQMIERKIPTYPFDVIQDTPKGKQWLTSIYQAEGFATR